MEPEGLSPELPPLVPGAEALEGALSPLGALSPVGRLSPEGALADEGALALEGWLAVVGLLSVEGALAPLGAEVVCADPRPCPATKIIDTQRSIMPSVEESFISKDHPLCHRCNSEAGKTSIWLPANESASAMEQKSEGSRRPTLHTLERREYHLETLRNQAELAKIRPNSELLV